MHNNLSARLTYTFARYVDIKRWNSFWHQINLVFDLDPARVLEIGPGPGVFKTVAAHFGVVVDTVDINPAVKPDFMARATELPFGDRSYDCVCAFQMLEHLPYADGLRAFGEMVRVSKKHLVISLPDAWYLWHYRVHIPMRGPVDLLFPKPRLRAPVHVSDGDHEWEISKRGYSLKKVIRDLTACGVKMVSTYRPVENPYHRFFVFEKT